MDISPSHSHFKLEEDNLPPTLFSLYLNELVKYVNSLNLGVHYGYTQVSMLACADDLIFIAESRDNRHEYCRELHLTVKSNKTQLMHFRKLNTER